MVSAEKTRESTREETQLQTGEDPRFPEVSSNMFRQLNFPLSAARSVSASKTARAPAPFALKVAEMSSGAGVRSVETVTAA